MTIVERNLFPRTVPSYIFDFKQKMDSHRLCVKEPLVNIKSLIAMTRPGNSLMAAIGIAIGVLFSSAPNPVLLICLIVAGMAALSFGNVINDIFDIETDRMAHPDRALVTGEISVVQAIWFSIILAVVSVIAGTVVSPIHGVATLIPIILLGLYAWKLKGTPLIGNILVSLLVAYTLIFGALSGQPLLVILPAVLAFVTNLIREIVKDLADETGDRAAGITTTASLDKNLVNRLISVLILISILTAPLPLLFPQFRLIYPVVIVMVVFPLQIRGFVLHRNGNRTGHASNLKLQLLAGLLAIAAEGVRYILG